MGTRQNFAAAARDLVRLRADFVPSLGAGVRQIAEEILTDVKASRPGAGVPRDTGALAGSGRADGPTGAPGRPRVVVGFGDTAAPYALRQHEDLTYQHPLGEARYLVRGVERWQPDGSSALKALAAQSRAIVAAIARRSRAGKRRRAAAAAKRRAR